ncbi:MAG: hypothetical protein ACREPY_16715 [Rhodanobacteraceae bacterium]
MLRVQRAHQFREQQPGGFGRNAAQDHRSVQGQPPRVRIMIIVVAEMVGNGCSQGLHHGVAMRRAFIDERMRRAISFVRKAVQEFPGRERGEFWCGLRYRCGGLIHCRAEAGDCLTDYRNDGAWV